MRTFAVFALVCLAACSSSDPKVLTAEAGQALAAGDAAGAVAKYERAIERLDKQSVEFLRASMGRFQALARIEPTRTAREFKAFQAAQAGRVQDADFQTVIDELIAKGAFTPATELLELGQLTFRDSPLIAQLVQKVGKAAEQAGDKDAAAKLKGIGYVGND
jgi:hypothetical protein